MATGRIDIDVACCKGCELCISVCPCAVIALSPPAERNPKGYRYLQAVQPGRCTGCGLCARMCPDTAITVWRRDKQEGR